MTSVGFFETSGAGRRVGRIAANWVREESFETALPTRTLVTA
jgi:hypothetical protein